MNLPSPATLADTERVSEASYPPAGRMSWRLVVLNLGMGVLGLVAWRLGAPDLMIGAFVGTAGALGMRMGRG